MFFVCFVSGGIQPRLLVCDAAGPPGLVSFNCLVMSLGVSSHAYWYATQPVPPKFVFFDSLVYVWFLYPPGVCGQSTSRRAAPSGMDGHSCIAGRKKHKAPTICGHIKTLFPHNDKCVAAWCRPFSRSQRFHKKVAALRG